jgi:DNA-binding transcriptional LysR family regulator
MDRIELMRAFVRVVETGSLSRASVELRTTQPTVSKWMQRLEDSVGARLLQRNTRGIRLTEGGETYFAEARKIVADIDALESAVKKEGRGVSGRLRLNFPLGLGAQHLSAFALEFQAKHEALCLDVVLTDRVVDLVEDGVDLAVRLGGVFNPAVVARALGSMTYLLCATPAYVANHPKLKTTADLAQHNFLAYGYDTPEEFHTPRGVERVCVHTDLQVHDHFTLRTAILASRGIGRVARWLVHDDLRAGRLVEVLPGSAPAPFPAFAVYLPARPQPEKVKLLLAHLLQRVNEIPGWLPAPSENVKK